MNTLREVPHPDPIQLAIEVLSASFDHPEADEAIAGLALLREQAPQQSGGGNSGFESWYNSYSPAHKSDKQRACDAYAAGMGDPLATTAPAATGDDSEAVAYLDVGAGGYLDLGTDLTDEALSRLPKGRHALVIAGTYGIDGYIAAPTTQPAPQPSPVEQNESAYQRGYMDGMAKGRRDVDAAPQQDTELIRRLVEALTTLRATGAHEGFAHDIATTAITAGRARLKSKP